MLYACYLSPPLSFPLCIHYTPSPLGFSDNYITVILIALRLILSPDIRYDRVVVRNSPALKDQTLDGSSRYA